jgi:hypothetical protein
MNNNTTLSGSISGSGVDLEAEVRLTAGSGAKFKSSGNTAQFKYRAEGASSWTDAGASISINPTSGDDFFIQKDISRRVTGLSSQVTYEFRLDMVVETETGTIE